MEDPRAERMPSVRASRAQRRTRIRIGALVAGLTLVVAVGGAVTPGFVPESDAVPVVTRIVTPPAAAQSTPPPHTTATHQSAATHQSTATHHEPSAEFARAKAPSRGNRPPLKPLPAGAASSSPQDTAPAPEPAPEPQPVAGIPDPCSIDMPIDPRESAAEITDRAEREWGIRLTGSQWRDDEYRSIVQLVTETFDAVDCTDYLDRVKQGNGGSLAISSEPTPSWSWGDYGLTHPNTITLDFVKFRQGYADGDRGRLVRLVIHEMAHSLNADRHAEPAYWRSFNGVWNAKGPVSAYGSTPTESFADAVGYYVARCANDNPYASGAHSEYYDYVRTNIFDGREFGGAVGTDQHCVIQGR